MPLQTGTWKINSSGTVDTLTIASVDTSGIVQGTLFGEKVQGIWDELSFRVSLLVGQRGGLALATLIYTGFLIEGDQFRMPGIAGGSVATLVGYYTNLTMGTTDKHVFGWYAQLGQD